MKNYIIFLLLIFCADSLIGASASDGVIAKQDCLMQLPDELLLGIAMLLVDFDAPQVQDALRDVEHFFSCNKHLNTVIKPMFYSSKEMRQLKFIKDYEVNKLLSKKYTLKEADSIGFKFFAATKLLDGKEIVVGSVLPKSEFAVVKYNEAGDFDMDFGLNGIVITKNGIAQFDEWRSVVVQRDCKILVGGRSGNRGRQVNVAIARYNADGKLDITFNRDSMFAGMNIIPSYSIHPEAYAASIDLISTQQDGKIIAIGFMLIEYELRKIMIMRLEENGLLDNSFGNGGIVIEKQSRFWCELLNVVVQNDGEIWFLVLVHSGLPCHLVMHIIKYSSTGELIR